MTIEIKLKNEDYNRIYHTWWFVVENEMITFRNRDTGKITRFNLSEIDRIENGYD